MSHVKAGGTAKNVKDSPGQRLGLKKSGGEKVTVGQIIFRQVGMTKIPGKGTKMSRNYTIHAAKDGVVAFNRGEHGRVSCLCCCSHRLGVCLRRP